MAGRGSQINPTNRFRRVEIAADLEQLQAEDCEASCVRTEYFFDDTKSIISENDSPDVGFRYSMNPYRGCAHGCSYCYARPTHEYFDLSAGLDFESKIFVKLRAPELFRDWLARSEWEPEQIMISGVTDCYQPAERHFQLTRRCLEVALEARQPVSIVTKNALITRDLDLLHELAARQVISVAISVTTLDQSLTRVMEPRTSSPAARLRTIEQLSAAGVPVSVLIAPVIPGLTDSEIPAILEAAHQAGACSAGYVMLRLPLTVKPVFFEWLERTRPLQKSKIESWIRSTRGGELYQAGFGTRMKGSGEIADQICQTFEVFSRRYGLDRYRPKLDSTHFRRPTPTSGQRWLFE